MIAIIILGAGVLFFIIDQYLRNEIRYWQKQTDFWMKKFSWMYDKYLEKELEMIEKRGECK